MKLKVVRCSPKECDVNRTAMRTIFALQRSAMSVGWQLDKGQMSEKIKGDQTND